MTDQPRLTEALRRRSLWQVLLVYLGASYAILEGVDLFIDHGLPDWFFSVALVLLIVGLPIILTTALVQQAPRAPGEDDDREDWRRRIRRLFTWRNAFIGVGAAFAVWGVVAAGWLIAGAVTDNTTENEFDLSAAGTLDPNTIAVLYFDDHSEGAANLHLADAFTEALTHELTQVPGLIVRSRSAVKQFKGTAVSPDSIARALNAGTLVEGSVLVYGDSLQVTVQPIEANTMRHLTSVVLTGRRDAPQQLLRELAREVSAKLRQALGREIRWRERLARTESDRAWETVYQARRQTDVAWQLVENGASEAAERAYAVADSLLAYAESLDRDWVEPIVNRGWVEYDRAINRRPDPQNYDVESLLAGLAHANRALELAPRDPSALEIRGVLLSSLAVSSAGDADTLRRAAERDLRTAVLIDTTRADAYNYLSRLLRQVGRFPEAQLYAKRALRADPYLESAIAVLARLCEVSIELKDLEEAYRWCRDGRRRYPERPSFMSAELLLLASVAAEVWPDTVWQVARTLLNALPEPRRSQLEPEVFMDVAGALARSGYSDSARALIERARSHEYGKRPIVDYREANVRLQLGEPAEAVRLLGRYLEAEPDELAYIAEDWLWKPLHDDPGFRELLGRTR